MSVPAPRIKALSGEIRPGRLIAGKFVIERSLGMGGMGQVVSARHRDLGTRVAIKLMHGAFATRSELRERFKREALAMASLTNEHVVRVYDVGQTDGGLPYIVMEHLDGRDLASWMLEKGPLSVDDALTTMLQVCNALYEAHAVGIIHRDLKPQNIFMERKRAGTLHVRILDFGLAKALGEFGAKVGPNGLTKNGALIGTPHYMAPEQIRGESVDERTDIWAAGVTLFRILTGHFPFDRATPAATCAAILTESPAELRVLRPEVPVVIDAIVKRCLSKKRSDRPRTMRELLEALLRARALSPTAGDVRISGTRFIARPPASSKELPAPSERTLPMEVKPPPVAEQTSSRPQRSDALALLMVVLLITLGFFGTVVVTAKKSRAPTQTEASATGVALTVPSATAPPAPIAIPEPQPEPSPVSTPPVDVVGPLRAPTATSAPTRGPKRPGSAKADPAPSEVRPPLQPGAQPSSPGPADEPPATPSAPKLYDNF